MHTAPHPPIPRGWVLIDADCGVCRGATARIRHVLHRLGYRLGALHAAEARGLIERDIDAMCTVDLPSRRRYRGADAVLAILRRHAWWWPLGHLLTWPGLLALARRAYHAFARRRHRFGCALPRGA